MTKRFRDEKADRRRLVGFVAETTDDTAPARRVSGDRERVCLRGENGYARGNRKRRKPVPLNERASQALLGITAEGLGIDPKEIREADLHTGRRNISPTSPPTMKCCVSGPKGETKARQTPANSIAPLCAPLSRNSFSDFLLSKNQE